MGSLRLRNCSYACHPMDERRGRVSLPQTVPTPASVVPLAATEPTVPDDADGSGELGVIPLETTAEPASSTPSPDAKPSEPTRLPLCPFQLSAQSR